MAETDSFVDGLVEEQRQIDQKRRETARETVAAQPLANIEEARRFAENWIVTAMQHAANEEYWRGRALAAEGEALTDTSTLESPMANYKPLPMTAEVAILHDVTERPNGSRGRRARVALEVFSAACWLKPSTGLYDSKPAWTQELWARVADVAVDGSAKAAFETRTRLERRTETWEGIGPIGQRAWRTVVAAVENLG
jgi:hypothetical protein